MHTILFVCTGNTCRSPMAEAVAQRLLDEGLLGVSEKHLAASAGVGATEGMPATAEALHSLESRGIRYDGRSKAITRDMVLKAGLVLCMTDNHVQFVRQLVADEPDVQERIQRLDPAADVSDPIGMGQAAYDSLVEHFLELIPKRIKELLSYEDRAELGSPRS